MSISKKDKKFLKIAKAIPLNKQSPLSFSKRIMTKVREIHTQEITIPEERFLKLARNIPVTEQTPYTFEKRIMAIVQDLRVENPFVIWSRVLWRAAAPCLGIMVLTALLSLNQSKSITDSQALLSQDAFNENYEINPPDFETVMLASFDDLEYTW